MIRLDNSLNSIIANSGYLRLDGTNVPTADYSWTTNFLTTGTLGAGAISGKGYTKNIVTKTGAYTLTANDDTVLGDTNAFTLTLPAAADHEGKVYNIKKINTEYDEALTIDGNASETIDGLTNYVLRTVDSGIIIQSDGTNWVIIGAI